MIRGYKEIEELLTLDSTGLVFWKTDFSLDGNVLGSNDNSGVLDLWCAPSCEEIAEVEAKEKAEIKQP